MGNGPVDIPIIKPLEASVITLPPISHQPDTKINDANALWSDRCKVCNLNLATRSNEECDHRILCYSCCNDFNPPKFIFCPVCTKPITNIQ
jgi:hypothetical protein